MEEKILCHGAFGEEILVSPDQLKFRPSVYGVVVKDGAVLLCPHWDGWNYPGGGIEKGERMADTLLREVWEETGLTVSQGKLLGVSENFFTPPFAKDEFWQSFQFYYQCDYVSGEITTDHLIEAEKEIMKTAQWIPIAEARTLKFYNPADNQRLFDAIE